MKHALRLLHAEPIVRRKSHSQLAGGHDSAMSWRIAVAMSPWETWQHRASPVGIDTALARAPALHRATAAARTHLTDVRVWHRTSVDRPDESPAARHRQRTY